LSYAADKQTDSAKHPTESAWVTKLL